MLFNDKLFKSMYILAYCSDPRHTCPYVRVYTQENVTDRQVCGKAVHVRECRIGARVSEPCFECRCECDAVFLNLPQVPCPSATPTQRPRNTRETHVKTEGKKTWAIFSARPLSPSISTRFYLLFYDFLICVGCFYSSLFIPFFSKII